jgi:hypothetical protein
MGRLGGVADQRFFNACGEVVTARHLFSGDRLIEIQQHASHFEGVERGEDLQFLGFRPSARAAAKGSLYAIGIDDRGEAMGHLHSGPVIEHREGLERRVAAGATSACRDALGGIKDRQGWGRRGPIHERIDATAMAVISVAGFPFSFDLIEGGGTVGDGDPCRGGSRPLRTIGGMSGRSPSAGAAPSGSSHGGRLQLPANQGVPDAMVACPSRQNHRPSRRARGRRAAARCGSPAPAA